MYMLACGVVFFPGLFFITRKVLESAAKNWNDADVFVVSERLLSSVYATLATIVGFIIATASSDVMSDR
uniref:Uncharacterized protein n=1 Tax=Hucho hucho TaxID=62062 RepID=A0A4W5LMM4_9TELE